VVSRLRPNRIDRPGTGQEAWDSWPALQAGDITVQTSARRQARAPGGFSHLLRTLAQTR